MEDNLYLFAVLNVNELQDSMTPDVWGTMASRNAFTAASLYRIVNDRQTLIEVNIDFFAGKDR